MAYNSGRKKMMEAAEFTDYYEIPELSPNATSETKERTYRYLAQRYHPDNLETGDRLRFDQNLEAHDTLKDQIRCAQYGIKHKTYSGLLSRLAEGITGNKCINLDTDIQNKLLSILYVKCRQDLSDPGIRDFELVRLSGCPAEHLRFHLWYLKAKGWVARTEEGMLAITVEGVDRAISKYHHDTAKILLTDQHCIN